MHFELRITALARGDGFRQCPASEVDEERCHIILNLDAGMLIGELEFAAPWKLGFPGKVASLDGLRDLRFEMKGVLSQQDKGAYYSRGICK